MFVLFKYDQVGISPCMFISLLCLFDVLGYEISVLFEFYDPESVSVEHIYQKHNLYYIARDSDRKLGFLV